MADWTDTPYPQLVAGKPWTDEKALAAFENVVALSECADGSPYMQTAWHPYNGFAVGDGITGRLWSFAVDGAVSTITTPGFVDGFEYRLRLEGVSVFGARLELYREVSAGWADLGSIPGTEDGGLSFGEVEIFRPRVTAKACIVKQSLFNTGSDGVSNASPSHNSASHGVAQKIVNARLVTGFPGFRFGAIYMDKRRVYA